MEGGEAQSKKQGHAEYGEGTSRLLRLCAPWRGTARTIISDSAFSNLGVPKEAASSMGIRQ